MIIRRQSSYLYFLKFSYIFVSSGFAFCTVECVVRINVTGVLGREIVLPCTIPVNSHTVMGFFVLIFLLLFIARLLHFLIEKKKTKKTNVAFYRFARLLDFLGVFFFCDSKEYINFALKKKKKKNTYYFARLLDFFIDFFLNLKTSKPNETQKKHNNKKKKKKKKQ